MSNFLDNPTAYLDTPEARSAIAAARAESHAKATETVRRHVMKYSAELLPGAIDHLVETQGSKLRGGSPADVAVNVYEYLQTPAADPLRHPGTVPVREQPVVDFNIDGPPVVRPAGPPKPAGPKTDSLRAALVRFAADFKAPAMMEKFYAEHALTYAHADPADAIRFVVGALHDRNFRAYQKDEAPPDEATIRLVEALQPFDSQLKGRLLDLAEGEFSDMAGINSPRDLKHLATLIASRLKDPRSAPLLVGGEFHPERVVRPTPGQQQAEASARPPLFTL